MKTSPNQWVEDPVKLARWIGDWLVRLGDLGLDPERSVELLVENAVGRGASEVTLDQAFALLVLEAEADERFSAMGL